MKYGLYIKGRGWIKNIDFDKGAICCRNFTDVHADFKFQYKTHIEKIHFRYLHIMMDLDYEVREITEDELIDKRVVPSKKYQYNIYQPEPFNVSLAPQRWYDNYCPWCQLYINETEANANGVCIHCLMELANKVKKLYNDMDDDIKNAWQRAKLMDEI